LRSRSLPSEESTDDHARGSPHVSPFVAVLLAKWDARKHHGPMELHRSLFEIAKLLFLAEEYGDEHTSNAFFRRVLEVAGADRGVLVARQEDGYEEKLDVSFDAGSSSVERRLSRSLVQRAIDEKEVVYTRHPREDPRDQRQLLLPVGDNYFCRSRPSWQCVRDYRS
jgi:hypothetical protein